MVIKMTDTQKTFNIHDYIDIAYRRKWYVVIPLVVSILVSFGVYKNLPRIYKATTLILVQSQRIPESYVRATVTDSVNERLSTISQEILTHSRLEKVIEEFNLYSEMRGKVSLQEIVGKMKGAVEVKVQPTRERTQNTFTISYEGRDPRTVMMVTNKLASLFIEENLKIREMRAEGTSEFIIKELVAMEDQLKKKDHDLREYKERYMGQLPQQLDANLKILDRLQQQLKMTGETIRAAEDRATLAQNQMDQLKQRSVSRRGSSSNVEDRDSERPFEDDLITQWNNLKKDLANIQSRYTDSHPDVIALKKKISQLEPSVKELLGHREETADTKSTGQVRKKGGNLTPFIPDPNTERLFNQYSEGYKNALLEARRAREEEKSLKDQIAIYQKRIEDTPKREQELILLTRDYDLLKANYQSLLDKKIQAQMAENLERKQQGEQFRILDPARVPGTPIKPDRNKILLMGLMAGLATGLGLAWFRESLDQSFHTVSDVETYLGIPVLVTIPNLNDKRAQSASYERR
jgi:polysaccharide chain length determinant protein (PEP-CTERM system associated)